jgi:tetratricopeptide (TPR) repeat protein
MKPNPSPYWRAFRTLFTLLLLAGLPALGRAHESLDAQIDALTQQLMASPREASLYLQRGELYRLHRDWDAAGRDYASAARFEPQRATIPLCRAALALDRGTPAAALACLDRYLEAHPADAAALELRSRVHRALGDAAAAVADLSRAIEAEASPRPDWILQRARWLSAPPLADWRAALAGLDAGIARLGPLVSLEEAAIALELSANRPQAARGRLAHIESQAGPQSAQRAAIEAVERQAGGSRAATVAAVTTWDPITTSTTAAATADAGVELGSAAGVEKAATQPVRIAATLTRAPYLQMGTPTSIVVRWRTNVATDSRVRYGSATPAPLPLTASNAALVTEHALLITGLAPNTRYYYSVGSSTETLAGGDLGHYFVTAPPTGTSKTTRIWILGDSGKAGSAQNAVRNAYATYTGSRETDVWLMLGDNAYDSGTDTDYQAGLFVPYTAMLAKCVLWPTRGNHDQLFAGDNNDYYELFTLPANAQAGGVASGTEAYYSFDYGDIHFVCLDSEGSDRLPTGAMATWLKTDLTANESTWRIAFWHHPPYTKGSHDSDDDTDSDGRMRDMRTNIVPILDSLGVDLTLTGHSHSYERSYLLDRHYGISTSLLASMKLDSGSGDPNSDGAYLKPTIGQAGHEGTVHAVAGSSSHTSGGSLNHPAMYRSLNVLGSMVIDTNGRQLTGRFLDNNGSVRDAFVILKGNGIPTGTEVVNRVALQLDTAQPNPFRATTRIEYALPNAGPVRLTIHDAAGRRVATLVEAAQGPGAHSTTWNGLDHEGRHVATGVYFARLEFGGAVRRGKLVLSQ